MLFQPSQNNLNPQRLDQVLIASDVDRTLVAPPAKFLEEEIAFLNDLHKGGVQFFFATGRSESAARDILSSLPFPFFLAPQNGTTLLQMPEGRKLKERTLYLDELPEELLKGWLFMGEGVSFYDPRGFSSAEESYAISRAVLLNETLVLAPPTTSVFSLKKFGSREVLAKEVLPFIELGYTVTLTKDMLRPTVTVAQVTPKGVHKGSALDDLLTVLPRKPSYIIGCGDDFNDLPLLERSHFKIVMKDAPAEVLRHADLVADVAEAGGLYQALKTVFR